VLQSAHHKPPTIHQHERNVGMAGTRPTAPGSPPPKPRTKPSPRCPTPSPRAAPPPAQRHRHQRRECRRHDDAGCRSGWR
jgi:hypothetical protein